MTRAARIVVTLMVAAFAVPALACVFEKSQTTTSAPASPPAVAKVDKSRAVKPAKASAAKAKPQPSAPVATRWRGLSLQCS